MNNLRNGRLADIAPTLLDIMGLDRPEEMTGTSLKINLVNPGAVRTSMRAIAYPGENPISLPKPEDVTEVFVQLGKQNCLLHSSTVKAEDYNNV